MPGPISLPFPRTAGIGGLAGRLESPILTHSYTRGNFPPSLLLNPQRNGPPGKRSSPNERRVFGIAAFAAILPTPPSLSPPLSSPPCCFCALFLYRYLNSIPQNDSSAPSPLRGTLVLPLGTFSHLAVFLTKYSGPVPLRKMYPSLTSLEIVTTPDSTTQIVQLR